MDAINWDFIRTVYAQWDAGLLAFAALILNYLGVWVFVRKRDKDRDERIITQMERALDDLREERKARTEASILVITLTQRLNVASAELAELRAEKAARDTQRSRPRLPWGKR